MPVRLQILKLISHRPLCVNAITRFLRISQPAVSQHLAVLRQAGLVRGEKSGYMVHYTLNRARLQEFRQAVAGFPDQPLSPMPEQAGEGLPGDTSTSLFTEEEPQQGSSFDIETR